MRAGTGPGRRVGRTASIAVTAIGKAGMCSSMCQGATIRSQAPPVLWSVMRCLWFFAIGELLALGEPGRIVLPLSALQWPRPHVQSSPDHANDQAMCVEPDFLTNGDQTLCTDHDAEAVLVQLGAHWLIARCRKVRLHAQRLISSANVCPAPRPPLRHPRSDLPSGIGLGDGSND